MATLLGSYWCGCCKKELKSKDGVIVGNLRTMVHIKCLSNAEDEIDRGYVEDMILKYILASHSNKSGLFIYLLHRDI
ncbi:hypothetical protein [Oceanobacillus kimchii]|uniref:hypothetical protein n=1 Tax=Oceanobacillus kimchii TaxID=746691 RepID=UPI00034C89AB|nr:hypothetical protein [Oceanobacillus kimchii]